MLEKLLDYSVIVCRLYVEQVFDYFAFKVSKVISVQDCFFFYATTQLT